MARKYARIDTAIWRDREWRRLSHDAQWAYMTILSQPKLSLVGCIDIKASSWDTYGSDDTDIIAYIDELEFHGFVLVDWDTDELVVRTFVHHDDVLKNRNLGRGMWGAWASVESDRLRFLIAENLPDEAWEPRFEPPFPTRDALLTTLQEPRFQPVDNDSGTTVRTLVRTSEAWNLKPQPEPEPAATPVDAPVSPLGEVGS